MRIIERYCRGRADPFGLLVLLLVLALSVTLIFQAQASSSTQGGLPTVSVACVQSTQVGCVIPD